MASPLHSARRIPLPVNRRDRRRAEIRERLFRAALTLFAERGYLETTVEDITEAADVGKGTFFNYFPTKEHVLATFGAERLAAIQRAIERARKQPVFPVLKELAADLANESGENAALLRSILAAHASCAPVRAELQKRLATGRRLMAEIFALGQQRGEVRRDIPAAELGRLTLLIFLGTTNAWSLDPETSLRATTQSICELLFNNIGVVTPRRTMRRNGAAAGARKIGRSAARKKR
jgi:AcrR family transcriptional regulator